MESGNFLIEDKEKSPSQKNTAHTMKREVESLVDFTEITKDEPSLKDLTAQFLQFETTGQPDTSSKNEFSLQHDRYDLKHEHKGKPSLGFSQEELSLNPEVCDSLNEFDKDPKILETLEVDSNTSSKDLLTFEDAYSNPQIECVKEQSKEKLLVNILDENKLSDEEISTGSDDLLFLPEKGESSPAVWADFEKNIPKKSVTECKTGELTESFVMPQPLTKFTSEPGLQQEQELENQQGDGLHVNDNFEADASDTDDIAPEPIPKDYPEIGVIEGKQFLAAIGLDSWLHPNQLNPKVESLIYWRDPKKSGIVFGSVLVILLSLTKFSLISVIAHTSLLVLIAALAIRIYKSVLQAVQKTSEGHPFKTYLDAVVNHPIITTVFFTIEEYLDIDLTLNPEKAREVSDVVISHVNNTLTKCRNLFLVEDVIDSVKFAILLWCLTYVGAWFNGLSLLIIAFVGLFTLPKVYENNKTQVDANIDIVKSKINDVSEKIRAVIPLGKKVEEVKDKGE